MTGVARVLLVAILAAPVAASQPNDAVRVLADMRQALGGDALNAVETFSVKGVEEITLGQSVLTAGVEWAGIRPDRFIEERHLRPGKATITTGFNGDVLIDVFKGTFGRGSGPPRRPVDTTRVLTAKQHFSRRMVGMFGITPVYPLNASYVIQETLDKKPVHVLELTGADGYLSRLYVDVASHLPRMISWMGWPVPRTPGQVMVMAAGGPLVEHQLFLSDYKKANGLNWPHRLTEVVSKVKVSETRLGNFRINEKIDPNRFEAR